ncbi:DNA replication regulator SLD3-domain-containing protein [Phlyctochytrium arcticum]|nr:DNA replication regulator SLD3-domain-containing protein [Phlyctochytrium arcticum]
MASTQCLENNSPPIPSQSHPHPSIAIPGSSLIAQKPESCGLQDNVKSIETILQNAYLTGIYGIPADIVLVATKLFPDLYALCESEEVEVSIATPNSIHVDLQPETPKRRAVDSLLDLITSKYLMTCKEIESKLKELPAIIDTLASYGYDVAEAARLPGAKSEGELRMLSSWVERTLATSEKVALQLSASRQLKQEIGLLKIAEAKIQILLLLECLKISQNGEIALPPLRDEFIAADIHEVPQTPERKGRKRKFLPESYDPSRTKKCRPGVAPLPGDAECLASTSANSTPTSRTETTVKDYTKVIDDMMDRLCIWQAVSGLEFVEGTRLLKSFIEPVIVPNYSTHLPEIVRILLLKAGSDPNGVQPAPPSPFFAKKKKVERESKRGSGMAGPKKSSKRVDKSRVQGANASLLLDPEDRSSTTDSRKLPEFMKGLGRRQIVLGKAKSKEAKKTQEKSSGSRSWKPSKPITSDMPQKTTSHSSSRTLSQKPHSPPEIVFTKRRKSSSLFENMTETTKVTRTCSMGKEDNNPFLDFDDNLKTPKAARRPFSRSNTVSTLFPSAERSKFTAKEKGASLGSGTSSRKAYSRSDLSTLPPLPPGHTTPRRRVPLSLESVTPTKLTASPVRMSSPARPRGDITPTRSLERRRTSISFFQDNEGSIAVNQTLPGSLFLSPSRRIRTPKKSPTVPRTPPSVKKLLIPSFNARVGIVSAPPKASKFDMDALSPVLAKTNPQVDEQGFSTPRKPKPSHSHTLPATFGTPTKTAHTPTNTRISNMFGTPTKTARTPSKRITGTPSATPGSCKRLKSMLEGFEDLEWDDVWG